jgi:methylated-DNA-protein-cysteine methyltransferase-like protein
LGINGQDSSLREKIWQIVAAIPRGRVASYGQIARLAGYPGHARYVGTTLRQLPKASTLPWHRVLRSNGELAFPVGSAPHKKQRSLLAGEGVLFKEQRVALRLFQWDV